MEKNEGDEAIGGSVNSEGALTIEIRKTGDKTYLSQINFARDSAVLSRFSEPKS